jgi:3-methyl-2-oxobutanoate hydroxymethyltransferase
LAQRLCQNGPISLKLCLKRIFKFGLPWGKHADATEALRDAMDAMMAGAQSVYCGYSPRIVEALAREGVPVICHVGLVPLQEFENAGSFAVEIEVVAAGLATEITKRTSMLTISLGSGGGCDAQYLFSADLLGENRGHIPRHAKTYRNFAAERDRLQDERVAAYSEYIADVINGGFPNADQVVNVDDDTLAKVWET